MSCTKDEIQSELNRINLKEKIVSFDIFDTLIFRLTSEPTDVFEKVGKRAEKDGILPFGITGIDYKNLRIQAEKKARREKKKKYGTTEVTFEEIFMAFPSFINNSKQLRELEFQIECEVCICNPILKEILENLLSNGNRVICISDMYFNVQQIEQIMQAAGYLVIPKLYISSETGKSKLSGELYEHVAECEKVLLPQIIHIGDNYSSDYLKAKECGMHPIFYDILSDNHQEGLMYEKMMCGSVIGELSAIRRYSPYMNAEMETDLWYKTGIQIYGPLLTGYAEWILDVAEKERINRIFPLMREGKILTTLLQNAALQRKMEIEVTPLYISRKAVFIPSMDQEISKKKLEDLFNASKNTLHDVLKLFGLEKWEEYYRKKYGDSRKYSYYEMADSFYEFLHEKEIGDCFRSYRLSKSEDAYGYFKQMGLDESFITVDIGFHGTIQRGLESILQEHGIRNHNIHLLGISPKTTAENVVDGVDLRGYLGSYGENNELNTYITFHHRLLEQALMCDEGSTKDYCCKPNQYEPIVGKSSVSFQKQNDCIAKLQQGIIDLQKEFLLVKARNSYIAGFANKISELGEIYQRLVKFPTEKEALVFGRILHDENYGVDDVSELCDITKIDFIKRYGWNGFCNQYDITKENWIEGLRTCADADYRFLCIKQNANTRLSAGMAKLAETVAQNAQCKDNSSVVIIGAGEAGRMLFTYLNILGIQVEAFIDNNKLLQGTYIGQIAIRTIKAKFKSEIYALGTLAFTDRLLGQALATFKIGSEIYCYHDGEIMKSIVEERSVIEHW